jgi:hypothetical protein
LAVTSKKLIGFATAWYLEDWHYTLKTDIDNFHRSLPTMNGSGLHNLINGTSCYCEVYRRVQPIGYWWEEYHVNKASSR